MFTVQIQTRMCWRCRQMIKQRYRLANCTGCGCRPSIYSKLYESGATKWHVQCIDYNCIPPGTVGETKDEAVERWNAAYEAEDAK